MISRTFNYSYFCFRDSIKAKLFKTKTLNNSTNFKEMNTFRNTYINFLYLIIAFKFSYKKYK